MIAASPPPAPLPRMLGQMIISPVDGSGPGHEVLAAARSGRIGGIVLDSRNGSAAGELRRIVAPLQRAAHAGGNPPLLVAVDQEGGLVRRVRDARPLAPARAMGTWSAGRVRREGRRAADGLRRAGVNVDLAPVADVAASARSFIWRERRSFGFSPAAVAAHVTAFASGLADGRVLACAKHFPGLGSATRNTDLAPASLPLRDAGLVPFRALIRRRVSLVMVASASYPALSRAPAALAPEVVQGLLRRRLGFSGLVITDSLQSAALARQPRLLPRAVAAGDDLLLFTRSERSTQDAERRLLATVGADGRLRSRVAAAYARILHTKRARR